MVKAINDTHEHLNVSKLDIAEDTICIRIVHMI